MIEGKDTNLPLKCVCGETFYGILTDRGIYFICGNEDCWEYQKPYAWVASIDDYYLTRRQFKAEDYLRKEER